LTDCVIYNVSIPGMHPSTICVEVARLADSITSLPELIRSEYVNDTLAEFISDFSRTEETRPEDRTVGFVVVNLAKKVVSVSLTRSEESMKDSIRASVRPLEAAGVLVELDLA